MKKIGLLFSILIGLNSFGQSKKADLAILTKAQKGIEFVAKDSLFSLRLQFRMQNRAAFISQSRWRSG